MATDIMDRAAQMFPKLTREQIERVSGVGTRREVRAGEVLFDIGDQNTRFFVVLSGAIEIVRPSGEREEKLSERSFSALCSMLHEGLQFSVATARALPSIRAILARVLVKFDVFTDLATFPSQAGRARWRLRTRALTDTDPNETERRSAVPARRHR